MDIHFRLSNLRFTFKLQIFLFQLWIYFSACIVLSMHLFEKWVWSRVFLFFYLKKRYHSPHLHGGLGENWLWNYLEDPIVVELKPQLGCPNSTTYLFASDCIFSSNLHILRTVLNVKVNVNCRSPDIRRWVLLIDMLTPCNLTWTRITSPISHLMKYFQLCTMLWASVG